MRKAKIKNRVTSIPIDMLTAHPGNPNRMSKRNFARLVRNIERTGRYEPLVVRRRGDSFQIINGHHRCWALKQLGYEAVDAVVWDVDDTEANILLSSLNRLGGSDVLEKKLALLKRIKCVMEIPDMHKIIPYTRAQIEKLTNPIIPSAPSEIDAKSLAVSKVFFLNDAQHQIVEQALLLAGQNKSEKTKAARNAASLTEIARIYIFQNEKSTKSDGSWK